MREGEETIGQGAEKISARGKKLWSEADKLRDAGDWPGAAKIYSRAIEAGCEVSALYVQYGHALKESGNVGLSEAAYRRAIELDAASADPYLQLGHVLKMQGRTQEAGLAYLQAHLTDPAEEASLAELSGLGWTPSTIAMVAQSRSNATPELALHVLVARLSATLDAFSQKTAEKLDAIDGVLRELSWSMADQRSLPASKGDASSVNSLATELYAIRSNMWLLRARQGSDEDRPAAQ